MSSYSLHAGGVGCFFLAVSIALGQKPSQSIGIQSAEDFARQQIALGIPDPRFDARSQAENPAWQRFLATAGGQWISHWSPATNTPTAVFGTGLSIADWRGNSQAEASRHARQLLVDQQELLGLGTSEFREAIAARIGGMWSFVYDQYYRGLPVLAGRADVRVHMTGKVSMFGSAALPIAADFVIVPSIDELNAARISWQALGQQPRAKQPNDKRPLRLVIYGDLKAPALTKAQLAYEVPVSAVDFEGRGPIGRYLIDAHSGEVLTYINDKHECGIPGCTYPPNGFTNGGTDEKPPALIGAALPPTTGTVRGFTRTGNVASDPLVNVPLAGVELSIPGVGIVVTDANGSFAATIASPVVVVATLNGIHNQLILGATAPTATFTLTPGVPAVVQFLTSLASPEAAAHTTTYWWVNKVNEFSRSILGNTAQLNIADAVLPSVNLASTCNAYYTNNTINFYATGGGCANTAFSTIVAHEWGHGLDERYGGISQVNGLSEGWGDILAMYLTDTPIVGDGFFTTGGFIRTGNNTRQYPSGTGVHQQGESFMGFAWNLRDGLAVSLGSRALAIALSNTLVVGSIAANAPDQSAAVTQIFLADDNDGNVLNGTPHSGQLITACNLHSLPNPVNPPTSPANDECLNAISITSGVNGPYTNSFSTTSSAWPCALGSADVWFRYVPVSSGTVTVDICGVATFDTALEILFGSCGALTSLSCNDDSCALQSSVTAPITAGTVYFVRVGGYSGATGPFSINLTGPPGGGGTVPAATTNYGIGCYIDSRSFYESFPTAGAFDLSNLNMRLASSGGRYIASAAGNYVAPTGAATVLALTDDSEVSVALLGAFPYPGGTTSSLVVCSNGFVSVATGNGSGFTPNAAQWLGSAQMRWGDWHDYNPSSGVGRVKFEQVGSVAFVTWDGVVDFGATTANTWQLQFNLSNGSVTYAWSTMGNGGNLHLVGFAAGGASNDLGSRDISTSLPGGFSTGVANSVGLLQASSLPQIGTTLTITTSGYPSGAALGVGFLSFTHHDPGLDLTSLGMPNCFQYVGLDISYVMIASLGQSTFTLTIPNNPALAGLAFQSQAFALVPGINSQGAISSNGVRLVIGT
ncbi:MAG: hypothetical protein EXS02_05995 [Planctomycetes bacterium]|nr:hypothetical protein [Planctomycetota bacterium]